MPTTHCIKCNSTYLIELNEESDGTTDYQCGVCGEKFTTLTAESWDSPVSVEEEECLTQQRKVLEEQQFDVDCWRARVNRLKKESDAIHDKFREATDPQERRNLSKEFEGKEDEIKEAMEGLKKAEAKKRKTA